MIYAWHHFSTKRQMLRKELTRFYDKTIPPEEHYSRIAITLINSDDKKQQLRNINGALEDMLNTTILCTMMYLEGFTGTIVEYVDAPPDDKTVTLLELNALKNKLWK